MENLSWQFLQTYLFLDILGETFGNSRLTLTYTGSHHCMCEDGGSLNQCIDAAEENDCTGATRTICGFFLLTKLQILVTRCVTSFFHLGP